MKPYDVAIVGGGIVGLATAYQLLQSRPDISVLLLEKEPEVASHQTGHNSGVIHSGIYYQPGSLRAINCRAGKLALEQFCEAQNIPFERCGKVIVATCTEELPSLEKIWERGQANGVACERIGPEQLRQLEPHVRGVAAIHVPEAGIVNYRQVAQKMGDLIQQAGGEIRCGVLFQGLRKETTAQILFTNQGEFAARLVVTCAGLHSDRVAQKCGLKPAAKIIPFRGEYFVLKPRSEHLCRNLVYPVPDIRFPFLGVHFTRMIGGGVECGPNAVLAFSREGYQKFSFRPGDVCDSLSFSGFRKLGWKYWPMGLGEMWRSFSKPAFVRALQRLVPEITAQDLVAAPSGVRAQAVSPQGHLIDDFVIEIGNRSLHVLNAPSPAATASLNIGRLIVDKIEGMLTD